MPARTNVNYDNIPEVLKGMDRWVVWAYISRGGGKPAKVPLRLDGVTKAQTNNPKSWSSFDDAVEAFETNPNLAGIGMTLPEGFVGVDLDDHIHEDGTYDESMKMVLSMFPTYAEISPSGKGVKLLCHGHISPELKKKCEPRGIEIYEGSEKAETGGRYFTITGNVIDDGHHSEVTGCRDAINSLQTIITDPIGDKLISQDSQLADELASENIEDAKNYVDHIDPEKAEYHDSWLTVGMAMHHVDPSNDMLAKWIEWSRKSDKFEEGACERRWASFGKNQFVNMVGLPYLKRLALENGYDPDAWNAKAMTIGEFMDAEFVDEYLVDNTLVSDQICMIGGASKSLKTSVALDLALSIASGADFLNRFKVLSRRKVFIISGESGGATLQSTLRNQMIQKGVKVEDIHDKIIISQELPKLASRPDRISLVRMLDEFESSVVMIDPLYMCLEVGASASNIYEMGAILHPILKQFCNAGITPILLHHFRKQGKSYSERPEMEDFSQSGIDAAARQWILLKRRSFYEQDGRHDLWANVGGSSGHGWGGILSVDTGTRSTGLRWNPEFYTMPEWDMEKEKRAVAEEMFRMQEVQRLVFEYLQDADEGAPVTAITKQVRERGAIMKVTRADVDQALHDLTECDQVVSITQGNKTRYFVDEVTASLL